MPYFEFDADKFIKKYNNAVIALGKSPNKNKKISRKNKR